MKYKNKTIRKVLVILGVAVIGSIGVFVAFNQQPAKSKNIVVYKDPNCGCCTSWIKHLRRNDFNVEVHDQKNMTSIKSQLDVPSKLQSCHTASIGGYTIEGHVPADLIERLLDEKSELMGLAVPNMPLGSPGMEGPRKDAYSVLAFMENGTTTVYANR